MPDNLVAWTRTHFAAFCIASSPLVLSIWPSDANLDPILNIVGSKLAIEVNQAWAGHPGSLVRTLSPAPSPSVPSDVLCRKGQQGGGDIFQANMSISDGIAWCKTHAHCGGFTSKTPFPTSCPSVDGVLELHFKDPWGVQHANADPSFTGWAVGGSRPIAGVQLWAKPLGHGRTAALFINGDTSNHSTWITLKEMNLSSTATVTDVWTGANAGPMVNGQWNTGAVAPLDSRFVIFSAD